MVGRRLAAWLAGLWTGLLVTIAALVAPLAFMTLPRADAGRFVGRLFAAEAYAGLAAGVVVLLLVRRGARGMSADMVFILGALFCTVAGHFALLPLMEQARAGQGVWSFAALHGAAAVLFGVKALAVAVLAFRLTRTATSS